MSASTPTSAPQTNDASTATPADPPRRLACTLGWLLILAFVVTTAACGGIARNVMAFQTAYAAGFAGYALLCRIVLRNRPWGSWPIWFAAAIGLRAALLWTTPSDDIHRYVWEGRVQRAGFNPFVLPPAADELIPLRDGGWAEINHPDYTAIYLPLAQLLFRALASIAPSAFLFKAVFVGFDAITILFLGALLRTLKRPPHQAILYALCPVTLTAFAVEGHLDSMMLTALAAFALLCSHKRYNLAGVVLGLAITAKLIPIVCLPWLFLRSRRAAAACILTIAALYLPFLDAGIGLFASLARFTADTHFFGIAQELLAGVVEPETARLLCALAVAAVAAHALFRRPTAERYCRRVLAALIIFMPIVHPWYLTWLLLFLPFAPPRIAWIVLAGSLVFYYEAARNLSDHGIWSMPTWVPLAVYLPFGLTWTIEWLRLVRPSFRRPPTADA